MSASWIVNLILALSPTLVNRQRALFKVLKLIFFFVYFCMDSTFSRSVRDYIEIFQAVYKRDVPS